MASFSFMQLADTQFGQFADLSGMTDAEWEQRAGTFRLVIPEGHALPRAEPGIRSLDPERERYAAAVAAANTLRPAFVVVCGDLVHRVASAEQHETFLEVGGQLADEVPLYVVPGNHDLSLDAWAPTPDLLSAYRTRHGDDYYAFEREETLFLALNSETFHRPDYAPEEAARQFQFVQDELASERAKNAQHIVAFMHTPLFWRDLSETQPGAVSRENRLRLLDVFREHGVDAVFAGHLHQNLYATDGDMQMVVSGAVGLPTVGESGYRVVDVSDDGISHEFHPFDGGLANP
jgi:3',5'-cyclic AMP phosphodiesterase CpdA